MITTATWVPRGFAAPFPQKYSFDEEEFERIAQLAKLQLDDAKEDLEEAQANDGEAEPSEAPASTKESKKSKSKSKPQPETEDDIEMMDDDLKEYDLEHYDDDDEENTAEGQEMGMFGNIKSLAYYENNKDDPYITLPAGEDEEEDEREDLQILATDNLVLAAKVEDEMAHLEVYVYEDEADNLYVHHDIMLPAIPLCVEWLDIPVGKPGVEKDSTANFVAVGTMDPDIELWDLDTVDCMYPNAILGQGGNAEEEKKKKKKKKKSKKANDEYHVDAVLSLAANRKHRNLLASASADQTVKLWDLHTAKCAKSYSYHTDKVCSLAWHAVESTVLLSGSYDRTVVAADMRAPDAKAPRWGVESDVENVRWDPHDPNFFFVSTENGVIHYYDIRNASPDPAASKAVWKLQAHDESVSSFDINSVIPGFMATGSTDKTVKLWNITPTGPGMVVSRNLDVGKVFSTTFAPDAEVAFRLAVAGSKGTMSVWDTSTNAAVRRAFANKLGNKADEEVEERLIGVEDDESSSEDEEEEESGAAVKQSDESSEEDV
ncbi:putative periodic tryptophan protein 1 protein [Phaeoacremonium minimum UCRPA7]|uniref:Putative periodic tryptophan protein 1 protein n=1 Tax=Phaeoacremonium minimum (strain UCR-PA7) TaxID=1286976 RepID=R8BD92_PHAM7|nr:putative periodic tryptophan protein 1 protein [Phaeoacremonium minimum UCRPA7]EON97261.1 putative periodic tryptophan protein 1 protein [Phaeoacremonium minimum UCRPA7]